MMRKNRKSEEGLHMPGSGVLKRAVASGVVVFTLAQAFMLPAMSFSSFAAAADSAPVYEEISGQTEYTADVAENITVQTDAVAAQQFNAAGVQQAAQQLNAAEVQQAAQQPDAAEEQQAAQQPDAAEEQQTIMLTSSLVESQTEPVLGNDALLSQQQISFGEENQQPVQAVPEQDGSLQLDQGETAPGEVSGQETVLEGIPAQEGYISESGESTDNTEPNSDIITAMDGAVEQTEAIAAQPDSAAQQTETLQDQTNGAAEQSVGTVNQSESTTDQTEISADQTDSAMTQSTESDAGQSEELVASELPESEAIINPENVSGESVSEENKNDAIAADSIDKSDADITEISAEEMEEASEVPSEYLQTFRIKINGVSIELTTDEEDMIPETAYLDAREYDKEEYASYINKITETLEEGKRIKTARIFSFSVMNNQEEIELQDHITAEFRLADTEIGLVMAMDTDGSDSSETDVTDNFETDVTDGSETETDTATEADKTEDFETESDIATEKDNTEDSETGFDATANEEERDGAENIGFHPVDDAELLYDEDGSSLVRLEARPHTLYAFLEIGDVEEEEEQEEEQAIALVETTLVDPAVPELSVSGMLPEGGTLSASALEDDVLEEMEHTVRDQVRAENPLMLFVADSGYDITILDEAGEVFEPDEHEQTVTVSIAKESIQEGTEMVIAHESREGGIEELITAVVQEEKIEYEAEHFSKSINGVTYEEFAGLSVRATSDHATAYRGQKFALIVSFTMEDLKNALFYAEIPNPNTDGKYLVDYSSCKGDVYLSDGTSAEPVQSGKYKVEIENGKAYLCITLNDHVIGSAARGEFTIEAEAANIGTIKYGNTVLVINEPDDQRFENLSITKTSTIPAPVTSGTYQGGFKYTFEVTLKNNGTEDIEDLTIYDSPKYFDKSINKDRAWPAWPENTTCIFLQYPDQLTAVRSGAATAEQGSAVPGQTETGQESGSTPSADGNITLSITNSPKKLSDVDRVWEYQAEHVTIKAGEELKWTYDVYLTKEEAEKANALKAVAYWTNYAGFRHGENIEKEVSRLINYTPDSNPMTKTGRMSEDGKDMEWTVSLETSGAYNAAGKYITDVLNKKGITDLQYIIDNAGDQRPYVYTYINGTRQAGRTMLTWTSCDDVSALIEEAKDPAKEHDSTKLYYDNNGRFIWFSEPHDTNDERYGYELHYWTNFDKSWLGKDSINQAGSNFSDRTSGIEGQYEAAVFFIKQLQQFDKASNLAHWKINVPITLTSPIRDTYIRDYLPNTIRNGGTYGARVNNLRDRMAYMDSIHIGDMAGSNSLIYAADITEADGYKFVSTDGIAYTIACRYWEFSSVEELTKFSGIRVEAKEKTPDGVFCEGENGKVGFYTTTFINSQTGKPAGGMWWIYPNATHSEATKTGLDGMSNLSSYFPTGDYEFTFYFTSITPEASKDGEVNSNHAYFIGTTAPGNKIAIHAYASYFLPAATDVAGDVEKKIAKVEAKEDGKLWITYMVLADNRSNRNTYETIKTSNYYEDYFSGVPEDKARLLTGDPVRKDGVKIYKIKVEYDENDPTGWKWPWTKEPTTIEEIVNNAEDYKLLERPLSGSAVWGGITREILESSGFRFLVPNQYVIEKTTSTHQNIFDYKDGTTIDWKNPEKMNFSEVTKSSYFFIYTIEVDAAALAEGNNVLRNTINRYTGPSMDGSSYVDYSILANELRKSVTERPSAQNDYTVTFELDVKMLEQLKEHASFAVKDKLSDNLELDVQTLKIYIINSDGTQTLVPADGGQETGGYVSLYDDHNLSLTIMKPSAGWPDNYKIRYQAKLTDYEGMSKYSNEALIPEGSGFPQKTEGEIFIKRPEGSITNLALNVYKYDGNNTSRPLKGAEFKLLRLDGVNMKEKLAELEQQGGDIQAQLYQYLDSITAERESNPSDAQGTGENNADQTESTLSGPPVWTQFGEPKSTGDDGIASFAHTDKEAILYNRVYKLVETKAPEGYSTTGVKPIYFMFCSTDLPSYTTVKGVENYIRSYSLDSATIQIPNYKTSFRLYKVGSDDEEKKPLTGFTFELFADAILEKHIEGYANPNGISMGEYLYFPDIPVPTSGSVTYYLKETEAPEHYFVDQSRVFLVTVDSNADIQYDEKVLENRGLRDLTDNEKALIVRDSGYIGLTIANEPNVTSFEFNKKWMMNNTGIGWPDEVKEIKLTLTRTRQGNADGSGNTVSESVSFTVSRDMTDPVDLGRIDGSQISGTLEQTGPKAGDASQIYSYRITGLDEYADGRTQGKNEAKKWTYTLTEEQVSLCEAPRYIQSSGSAGADATAGDDTGATGATGGNMATDGADDASGKAENITSGGTIVNEYLIELPETGGFGTWPIRLAGALMMLMALGLYTMRKRLC